MIDDRAHTDPRATPDRVRLLDLLNCEDHDALTIDDLRQRGVTMPGQAIYELEVDGYRVERVRRHAGSRSRAGVGYRLRRPRR